MQAPVRHSHPAILQRVRLNLMSTQYRQPGRIRETLLYRAEPPGVASQVKHRRRRQFRPAKSLQDLCRSRDARLERCNIT